MVPWLCPGRGLGQGQMCARCVHDVLRTWWGEGDRPARAGTRDHRHGLDMTKRNRDLVERGAAPSTSGSGQVTGAGGR